MLHSLGLSRHARAYVFTIIVLGLCVVIQSAFDLYRDPVGYQWYFLAALTLVSGSVTVKLPSVPASISISEVFVFTAILLYGPAAGTITVALDGLVISFWLSRRRREIHRALFNMSAPALSAWCAAHLFFSAFHLSPLVRQPATLNSLLPGLVLCATTYFLLNSGLIALAISTETGASPLRVWRENFIWLSLNYFCGASIAVLVVLYTRRIDVTYLGVIVPLLLVMYFTFKTSMDRVEDAQRHLKEVNRLYLSTIETLAMAIDAKDQITHGHIRRVQSYAVGLAQEIGVRDDQLLRAIEAAALLHDMGKLAVPEYILNKPGKLTPFEFEKMKLHASVGADILTAVDFPYPVVPIVRHHHENWDGSGYPQGLGGTDIPLGARILAVVDCFDALRSDRPYRPRLSDEDAIRILVERRGTMYDPLIVDTFVRVHKDIASLAVPGGVAGQALSEITSATQNTSSLPSTARLDDIAASADEMLTLYELAQALAGQASVGDIGDVIAKHLRRLVPFSLCVFFIYDPSTDELHAEHTAGDATTAVKGLQIPLGQRLSGWVAANRQTIVNSDPTLDLGDNARCITPRLRNGLSTPLLAGGSLVGVLTLYSATTEGFSDEHRRVVEVAAKQIGHALKGAIDIHPSQRRDPITGLPGLQQLEHLLRSQSAEDLSQVSLIFVRVVDIQDINQTHGRSVGDDVLRQVVRQIRTGLRIADILFRVSGDEFAAFLSNTDWRTADTLASGIKRAIVENPVQWSGSTIAVSATIRCVPATAGYEKLSEFTAELRRTSKPNNPYTDGTIH